MIRRQITTKLAMYQPIIMSISTFSFDSGVKQKKIFLILFMFHALFLILFKPTNVLDTLRYLWWSIMLFRINLEYFPQIWLHCTSLL